MTPQDYSALATAVLRRKAEAPTRVTEPSRERCIAVIARAMEHSSRKRRRTRNWVTALSAVAAGVAIATTIAYKNSREPLARSARVCTQVEGKCTNGENIAVATIDVGHLDARRIVPGTVLRSGHDESPSVHFDSGTQVGLGADSTLVYDEGSAVHRFSISRGSARFQVAKLSKGERFLLNTLDAEIEVRGTVFAVNVVSPSSACGHQTTVSVDEGVVEVRTGTDVHTLHAGEHWPTDCSRPAAPDAHDSPRRKPHTIAHEVVGSPAPVKDEPTAVVAPAVQNAPAPLETEPTEVQSALAAQNDLYARASRAAKLGQVGQALTLFEQLIGRYPSSALIESAYAQRFRLLAKTNSVQARTEAQRYLDRFPHGFARAEARQLLGLQ